MKQHTRGPTVLSGFDVKHFGRGHNFSSYERVQHILYIDDR
jgi:hypothetical protein